VAAQQPLRRRHHQYDYGSSVTMSGRREEE